MRPHAMGPAHRTGALAELVCSNSLRGAALQNAVGLLKEELALLDSVIIHAARRTAVPAGGALAVDRGQFAALIEAQLEAHPRITIRRQEVTAIDERSPTIIACGPRSDHRRKRQIALLRCCITHRLNRFHRRNGHVPKIALRKR